MVMSEMRVGESRMLRPATMEVNLKGSDEAPTEGPGSSNVLFIRRTFPRRY